VSVLARAGSRRSCQRYVTYVTCYHDMPSSCLTVPNCLTAGVGTFANFQMADGHRSLGIQWYWGDLAAELEGVCSEVIFNLANTNGKGWDDASLQNNYYNKAKEV